MRPVVYLFIRALFLAPLFCGPIQIKGNGKQKMQRQISIFAREVLTFGRGFRARPATCAVVGVEGSDRTPVFAAVSLSLRRQGART